MGFTSLYFVAFLALLFPTYFLFPKRYRWIVLLAFSVAFYLLCSWKSIFFIIFSSVAVYFASIAMQKNKTKEKEFLDANKDILSLDDKKAYKNKNKKIRKRYLVLGIVSIVLVLAIMKYLNFLLGNVNAIFELFGGDFRFEKVNWLLPLGISFYTFQAIGYLADVYWGKYPAQKNFLKFFLFMSYFPKIMQGPIIRYNEIEESLFLGHDFNYDDFVDGMKRVLWGYFKKMVIADCLLVFTTYAFSNPSELSGFETVLVILSYFIADYCDFSGYMDIACGISKCMGVKLPENFNHPYFAKGIDDYWRRWHITLGTWFKDYIFYPLSISKFSLWLGKKSKKIFKKHFNKIPAIFGLVVVWFLTGLWHGASWNYILWGLYFGVIIILGIIFEPIFAFIYSKLKINKNAWWLNVIRHIRTLALLAFGKILFETNSLAGTFEFLSSMFSTFNYWTFVSLNNSLGYPSLIIALACSVIVLIVDLIQEKNPQTTFIEKTKKKPYVVQWAMFIGLIVLVVWFGYYGQGLPKFEFGYVGF